MKVASFLENIEFNKSKPAVRMLFDTDFSKEVRIVFEKGQIMEDHQAPFAIVVQVIKGSIDFGVHKELVKLKEGDLVALKPHIVHSLTALQDSVVRLTLSKSDSLQRVKNV